MFSTYICFSLACEQLTINIQSLLFIQVIPEIHYNHVEVIIVLKIYHGNEVAVCGPATMKAEGAPDTLCSLPLAYLQIVLQLPLARIQRALEMRYKVAKITC